MFNSRDPVKIMYEVRRSSKEDELLNIFYVPDSLSHYSIEELEKLVESDPQDMKARTKLLAKYLSELRVPPRKKMSKANKNHILWFVKNAPHLAIACECSGAFELYDAKLHDDLIKLWDEHVEEKADDFNILFNASMFFRDCSQVEKAIAILRKIEKMKKKDPIIQHDIEFLESLQALSETFEKKKSDLLTE